MLTHVLTSVLAFVLALAVTAFVLWAAYRISAASAKAVGRVTHRAAKRLPESVQPLAHEFAAGVEESPDLFFAPLKPSTWKRALAPLRRKEGSKNS